MTPMGRFLTEIVGLYLHSDLMISGANERNQTLTESVKSILKQRKRAGPFLTLPHTDQSAFL